MIKKSSNSNLIHRADLLAVLVALAYSGQHLEVIYAVAIAFQVGDEFQFEIKKTQYLIEGGAGDAS